MSDISVADASEIVLIAELLKRKTDNGTVLALLKLPCWCCSAQILKMFLILLCVGKGHYVGTNDSVPILPTSPPPKKKKGTG